ncbi:hypothetical protein [Pseudonocardia cypriaca]|uniref:hypothetical protein n=1 Tax=Pseudonocardia cypriaca TaxID=882449 RepID=UPI0011540B47|nr:hypothetical protein [Pseudonocardia cypriaca]
MTARRADPVAAAGDGDTGASERIATDDAVVGSHYATGRELIERVHEAVKRDPSLADHPDLADWLLVLAHLDASPIDVSGPAAVAIESIIGRSGDAASASLARKLHPLVRVRLGLTSPALYMVWGLTCVAAFLAPAFLVVNFFLIPHQGFLLGLPADVVVLVTLAGAAGSVVSLLTRVREFDRQRKSPRAVLFLTGLFRPIIGTIFGMFVYLLLLSELLPIEVPAGPAVGFYPAIAFIAGFSERFVPDVVDQAERGIVGRRL